MEKVMKFMKSNLSNWQYNSILFFSYCPIRNSSEMLNGKLAGKEKKC